MFPCCSLHLSDHISLNCPYSAQPLSLTLAYFKTTSIKTTLKTSIKTTYFKTTSLVIQWLIRHTFNARGADLIPGQGTKILHAVPYGKNTMIIMSFLKSR